MTRPAIRSARPDDAETLANIHVAAWRETYLGLLPEEEIARHDLPYRLRQWQTALARGDTRIALAGEAGFAQMGPQRDPTLAGDWPEELYAIYLLRAHHGSGLGRALLEAVAGNQAFTAFVLDGNARAMSFYQKTGAKILGRTPLEEGAPDHILIGWRRIVRIS